MIVNLTIEMDALEVVNFENWMRENVDVKDFSIIPDTKELYENNATFKRLCSKVKEAKKTRDEFYNNNR